MEDGDGNAAEGASMANPSMGPGAASMAPSSAPGGGADG